MLEVVVVGSVVVDVVVDGLIVPFNLGEAARMTSPVTITSDPSLYRAAMLPLTRLATVIGGSYLRRDIECYV